MPCSCRAIIHIHEPQCTVHLPCSKRLSWALTHAPALARLAGKYAEAAEKYARAKQNMAEVAGPDSQALRKACTLNLGSCYLNLGQYQQCVAECQEVLRGECRPCRIF